MEPNIILSGPAADALVQLAYMQFFLKAGALSALIILITALSIGFLRVINR